MMRRRFLQLVAAIIAFLFRPLPVQAYDGTISGNFAGTVPNGQHWHITGNVNLTGDLIVEGLLTTVDTFTLTGNGFQVLVQNGGVFDLAGIAKTAWVRWGDTVTGWNVGDRLGVAPMTANAVTPTVVVWQGSWAATSRPANAADLTLVNGTVAKPEVANLTRSITMTGLRRFHLHDGPGVQSLKHFAIVNAGTSGVLGDYPLHFHLNGDASVGSLVEGVVVEGGKHHAFVPHGSNGITFTGCVAYNTIDDAFWWDDSSQEVPLLNNSNDTTWDTCLVLWVKWLKGFVDGVRLTGFYVGSGHGNRCTNNVAAAVDGGPGGNQCSGYHWPSKANDNPGGTVWEFHHNTAHNSKALGYFSWQNETESGHLHEITDITAFNCQIGGVQHGAYINRYHWRRMVLGPNMPRSIQSRALPVDSDDDILFEDLTATAPFEISHHIAASPHFVKVKGPVPSVVVQENMTVAGHYSFEDTGLLPAGFTLTAINPGTVLIIKVGGVETHRWQSGAWT